MIVSLNTGDGGCLLEQTEEMALSFYANTYLTLISIDDILGT